MLKSLRTVLFLTYSSIIFIVFFVFILFFYSWSIDQLRDQTTSTLERLGESIQEQVNSQIDQINMVSLNVIYSNLVKERFISYMSGNKSMEAKGQTHSPYTDPQERSDRGEGIAENRIEIEPNLAHLLEKQRIHLNNDAKTLTEALTAIIGPSRLVEQIYLYSFDGRYYGTGFDTREQTYTLEEKPFIQQLLDQQPNKIISNPNPDLQLSKYYSSKEGKYSLSLYRLMYDEYNVPIGVIEVKQYAHRIFESVTNFEENNHYHGQIYVMNTSGEIIYPYEQPQELAAVFQSLIDKSKEDHSHYYTVPYTNPDTSEKQLLSLHYSDRTGWYTILTTSEKDLFKPLKSFTVQLFATTFMLIALGMGLSFYAANKITLPIFRIKRAIRNFSFEHIGSNVIAQKKMNSGITELNELHDTFQHMSERLKQSLDKLLLSEAQRLQSQLNALQSQMNPHFLFNTLANLQEMAEQHMNEQLVDAIEHMSDFLRYITSKDKLVSLCDELEHTLNYLKINKLRFGSRLTYHIWVPDELLDQSIPKLIVQPLVENSIKFATSGEPPWHIDIIGTMFDKQWQIEVRDTGGGFDTDKLNALQERMCTLEAERDLPTLELNGMGLLNIYLRLNLMYGEQKIFAISNHSEGGASIIIGGPLIRSDA